MSGTDTDELLRQRLALVLDVGVRPVTADEVIEERTRSAHDPVRGSRLLAQHGARWRVAASAAIVVVLSAGVVIGIAATRNGRTGSQSAGVTPPAGQLSGSVIIVPSLLEEIDAATGKLLPVPSLRGGFDPTVVGSSIVDISYSGTPTGPDYGQVVSFQVGSRQTIALGLASIAFPGVAAGTVWLWTNHSAIGPKPRYVGPCSIRLASFTGHLLITPRPIPCGWNVIGAVDRELVVQTGPSGVAVWNPSSGSTWKLPGNWSSTWSVPEVGGSTVVDEDWTGNFCFSSCTLLVADASTRTVRKEVLHPPSGMSYTQAAGVSLDGRFVALTAVSDATATAIGQYPPGVGDCCRDPDSQVGGDLVVVRSSSGSVVLTRRSSFLWMANLEWSPDDSFVFVNRSHNTLDAIPAWATSASERTIPLFPLSQDRGERPFWIASIPKGATGRK